jgi:hypothetical protein
VWNVAGVIDSGYGFVRRFRFGATNPYRTRQTAVAASRVTKNLAGFNRRFRFSQQKDICAAAKKGRAAQMAQ